MTIKPLILENPLAAFRLSDELWKDDVYEVKKVSAIILGHIPACFKDEIMHRLITRTSVDTGLPSNSDQDILFEFGTLALRREHPDELIVLFKSWIRKDENKIHLLVLNAIAPIIQDQQFNNLPPIIDIMADYLKTIHSGINNELTNVFKVLAIRTPIETAYILNQAIILHPSPILFRLTRQILPLFEQSTQDKLRKTLKSTT
ncbi:MAG: hypothetical protein JEZ06_16900 [Anaerolineaceae bacterium]|nr:hypothetical protein [Anaerolineaceae bacterium]